MFPFLCTNCKIMFCVDEHRYVERAKEIVNAIVVNEDIHNPLIGKLREEVRGLQELLERKEAVIVEHEVKIRNGREGLSYASRVNHFVYSMRNICLCRNPLRS